MNVQTWQAAPNAPRSLPTARWTGSPTLARRKVHDPTCFTLIFTMVDCLTVFG